MRTYSELLKIWTRRIMLINCFCAISACFVSSNVHCQEIAGRPSVGLVLSGGGSHGIAHLGVIKVMEEAGLRPDCITGVSMGSIIGGLYSLGYTADSIKKILKKINWEQILSNKIPENKVIYLEKNNFHNYIISLPISSKKVLLPSGLINGQLIENTLGYYFWPAADINDFSKLPIPFTCVGTDIITYRKVDLKSGYLPDAVRASFSVPSIFTPIKIDTLLLLDGGLMRNFAASEAKDMGADIIIGSYVGFKPYKEEDLQSVAGIIKQIAFFRSLEDFIEEKKLVDILIYPKTGKFSVTSFENVDSLFEKGYEAALPYKDYFRNLADSFNLIGKQQPLHNILDKQTYAFDKIEITGNKTFSDVQIHGVLNINSGEKIDKDLLKDKIELLFGKSWFEKVKYKIVHRNDSLILTIDCAEQPKGTLYGSVHYDNSLLAGLIVGLSVKNLLTPRSVLSINSYIGQYYRFDLRSLQFIDRNQRIGLSANFSFDNTLIPMLRKRSEKGDIVSRNFIPGFSLIRGIGLNQLMSLSANYENKNLILHYNSNYHLKSLSYNYLTAIYDYRINSVDNKHFPDKGTILNISVSTSKLVSGAIKTDSSKTVFRGGHDSEFSFDRFFTLYGHLKHYFSTAGRLTFSVEGNALFITRSDSLTSQNNFYLLGGIESVSNRSIGLIGYHSNEIPIKKMAGIRTDIDIELFKDLHLTIMGNMAFVQEVSREKGFSLLSGYGLGIGYMSIIGPLKIGIMHGNYNRDQYFNKTKGYISIGYNF